MITSKSLWQNRKAWEPGQDITTVQVWSEMCSRITTQLLSLTAMEAPAVFSAKAVRDEKVKVLNSISDIKGKSAIKYLSYSVCIGTLMEARAQLS